MAKKFVCIDDDDDDDDENLNSRKIYAFYFGVVMSCVYYPRIVGNSRINWLVLAGLITFVVTGGIRFMGY